MAQIGFTDKQTQVYARFQKMRRDYEDENGRTYAPDFLTVLMDLWEVRKSIEPVSLRAYIADSEANDTELQPVRIKDGACRYIKEATIAAANICLTNFAAEAMFFNSQDQAKAFLRKCGHDSGDWIIEPVN